ncbi:type I-B CRISPR-associated protein Cas7/Cst2/DevR [Hydrogenibacillus sp. N12]|uniref:type I-B CRISPR-associated protein Cas7/Cst2/DevR n=1 Tax=Hydrogenibacillus sp. N12 TaxID=2866627 RepID=UPI001C7DC73A|nr:type I-B CRISPR-associated protein Cas7/Cst2/DevR [Hydrogenibacillus sp. N12]QZA32493.1 type I-B CRISPR-associated protein Cas7/Cst2/DevR [Hydrogenibacillus sp. N12]
MVKAMAIGYLSKVSAGNVNAAHTEGNVVVAKKVTLPDGSALPYISGQAIRRMFRDRLADLGFSLSEPFAKVDGQEVTPPGRPWEFIDEDLFGYLDASGSKRRTSPVRVSAAIGLYPYQGDRDLGTRSFEKYNQSMDAGGNMFETEVYTNVFRGSVLIELDRVGVFTARELGEKSEAGSRTLDSVEREKRLHALLDALGLLWGGGRSARMLADLSPKFVALTFLSVKHPVFLEALMARYENGAITLDLDPLKAALDRFKPYQVKTFFGMDAGFLANEEDVKRALGAYGEVGEVHEAIRRAKDEVTALWCGPSA